MEGMKIKISNCKIYIIREANPSLQRDGFYPYSKRQVEGVND